MSGVLGTFGNTPAAKTLAKILHESNDTKNFTKISRMFSTFNRMLHELSSVHTSVRFGLGHLVYKSFRDGCKAYPESVRTYVLNVMAGSYRQWLVENDSLTPRKTRIKNE